MLFTDPAVLLLAALMLLAAALYTSVGHAGASAYIALMALFGMSAAVMRPTALVLNILVASLVAIRFSRAGLFRWRTLWPFLLGAAPMAYFGGSLQLPGEFYKPLVGCVLLLAAIRLLWPVALQNEAEWRDPPLAPAIPAGAAIGLLSGLTGTGGGIFLSPLLLFAAWSATRSASGVTAVFVLVNSVAGLLGNLAAVRSLPAELPLFAVAVTIGALIGSQLGIRRLPVDWLRRSLGLVLVIAGLKLLGLY
jgi:uncharacterized protein